MLPAWNASWWFSNNWEKELEKKSECSYIAKNQVLLSVSKINTASEMCHYFSAIILPPTTPDPVSEIKLVSTHYNLKGHWRKDRCDIS